MGKIMDVCLMTMSSFLEIKHDMKARIAKV